MFSGKFTIEALTAWKAIAASLAIIGSAWATAYAQARIGTAGAGAIAEKPESAGMIIALEALPELLVIMGFVVAAMIITTLKPE
jgi:V/A-type H+-transporting ATPase subunit K